MVCKKKIGENVIYLEIFSSPFLLKSLTIVKNIARLTFACMKNKKKITKKSHAFRTPYKGILFSVIQKLILFSCRIGKTMLSLLKGLSYSSSVKRIRQSVFSKKELANRQHCKNWLSSVKTICYGRHYRQCWQKVKIVPNTVLLKEGKASSSKPPLLGTRLHSTATMMHNQS